MAKHSPHIIKGAPYIPFELYEEHLARKDAALGMAVDAMIEVHICEPIRRCAPRRANAWQALRVALAACRAELEGK